MSKFAVRLWVLSCCLEAIAGCHDNGISADEVTQAVVHNTAQVSNSVSGTVTAMVASAGQAVALTFTSNDANSITQLQITSDLTALPPGWSVPASTFSCASVTTGSGCLLNLTYAPTANASGTLTLTYGYRDNAGAAQTGTVSIPYSATKDDNVVGTISPAGTVNAVSGAGTQAVTVTFTTDDSNPATALSVTSDLTNLPGGWSSTANSFSCSTVDTGNKCQLALTYAPSAGVSGGTLTVNYRFTDNAGTAKTAAVNIPYASTVHNTVTGTTGPTGQITANTTDSGQMVTVTFATNDGNPASSLLISTDLTNLPGGWSSNSTQFTCSSVSGGSGCVLDLTYAPTAAGSGTLSLAYSYLDNAGGQQNATVNINYLAHSVRAYVGDLTSGMYYCDVRRNGGLANCSASGNGLGSYSSVAFSGTHAYVADGPSNQVYLCSVQSNGNVSNCVVGATGLSYPFNIAINNGFLYVPNFNGYDGMQICPLNGNGTIAFCAANNGISPYDQVAGVAFGNGLAYLGGTGDNGRPGLQTCAVNSNGFLSSCAAANSSTIPTYDVMKAGSYIYAWFGNDLYVCMINADGSLAPCATENLTIGGTPFGAQSGAIAIFNGWAYVPYQTFDPSTMIVTYGMAICAVGADGSFSTSCSDSGIPVTEPGSITIQ